MQNPFVYDSFVTDADFCNRRAELHEITRACENAQNLLLFSQRRFGKTSLVKYALSKLSPNEYLPIYIDLWPTDDELSFAKVYAGAVGEAHSTDMQKIIEFARKHFPKLLPAITLDELNHPQLMFGLTRPSEVVPELPKLLNLPVLIARTTQKRIVVVLDEIQQILEYKNDIVERQLRSTIQQHRDIAYLFLGSRKHLIEKMFLDRQRPFYRSAAHLPLGPIQQEHWLPFIRNKFLQSHMEIPDESIELICATTQGHPRDTQHLCYVLWELAYPDRVINMDLITETVQQILRREDYAYTRIWEMLTIDQRRTLEGIAVEPATTQFFSAEFVETYGLKNPSSVQRTVQSLLKKDLLDVSDRSYHLTDNFLKLWIQGKASKTRGLPR